MYLSHTASDSRFKRISAFRFAGFLVATGVVFFLACCIRDYAQSQTLKKRLIGKWTGDIICDDGSVATWIWEFRPDGTIRNHPLGKPFPESGSVDDYIQWDVSGGDLVLSWDYYFTRNATVKQRLRQVTRLMSGKSKVPLAYSDRCLIHDDGGDTISLTLHPGETEAGAYVPRHFSLTRAVKAR